MIKKYSDSAQGFLFLLLISPRLIKIFLSLTLKLYYYFSYLSQTNTLCLESSLFSKSTLKLILKGNKSLALTLVNLILLPFLFITISMLSRHCIKVHKKVPIKEFVNLIKYLTQRSSILKN